MLLPHAYQLTHNLSILLKNKANYQKRMKRSTLLKTIRNQWKPKEGFKERAAKTNLIKRIIEMSHPTYSETFSEKLMIPAKSKD